MTPSPPTPPCACGWNQGVCAGGKLHPCLPRPSPPPMGAFEGQGGEGAGTVCVGEVLGFPSYCHSLRCGSHCGGLQGVGAYPPPSHYWSVWGSV